MGLGLDLFRIPVAELAKPAGETETLGEHAARRKAEESNDEAIREWARFDRWDRAGWSVGSALSQLAYHYGDREVLAFLLGNHSRKDWEDHVARLPEGARPFARVASAHCFSTVEYAALVAAWSACKTDQHSKIPDQHLSSVLTFDEALSTPPEEGTVDLWLEEDDAPGGWIDLDGWPDERGELEPHGALVEFPQEDIPTIVPFSLEEKVDPISAILLFPFRVLAFVAPPIVHGWISWALGGEEGVWFVAMIAAMMLGMLGYAVGRTASRRTQIILAVLHLAPLLLYIRQ